MKLTISVPDELGEWAQNADGLVVSRVCQQALARERVHREAVAQFADRMERHVIELHENPPGGEGLYTLIAVELFNDGRGLQIFLTRKGTIVVYEEWSFSFSTYSSHEDFEERWGEQCNPKTSPLAVRAAVAEALGVGTLLLDI